MSGTTVFSYADTLPVADIAAHLVALAEGLRRGSLELDGQGQHLTLSPSPTVKIEVKTKTRSGDGELVFEVSWKNASATENERLHVSSSIESPDLGGAPVPGAPPNQPSDT